MEAELLAAREELRDLKRRQHKQVLDLENALSARSRPRAGSYACIGGCRTRAGAQACIGGSSGGVHSIEGGGVMVSRACLHVQWLLVGSALVLLRRLRTSFCVSWLLL